MLGFRIVAGNAVGSVHELISLSEDAFYESLAIDSQTFSVVLHQTIRNSEGHEIALITRCNREKLAVCAEVERDELRAAEQPHQFSAVIRHIEELLTRFDGYMIEGRPLVSPNIKSKISPQRRMEVCCRIGAGKVIP